MDILTDVNGLNSGVLGGRYHLIQLLGQGGMSDVYKAVDQRSGTAVAVKIVRSGDPEFARRLAQETRALERIEHAGLISLIDTGFHGNQAYIVMELIDGPTLARLLQSGAMECQDVAALGSRLAGALAYAHGQGIVHRDVKPSNILLSANGEAWLGDFGIAQLHDASSVTATGTTLGTVSYMAPEQLEDHQVGSSADIWSLGIVLLECLTGQRVYQGSSSEIVAKRLRGPVPMPVDLPVQWKMLLNGMLAHEPNQRLNGLQVAELLSSATFSTPWIAPLPPVSSHITPESDDRTALIGAAGATEVFTSAGPLVPRPSATWAASASQRVRKHWLVASGAAVLVVATLALLSIVGPGSAHPLATLPTLAPATTTSPSTTTAPNGQLALAALVSAISRGQVDHTIEINAGQDLTALANQAVTDASAGNLSQSANDIQQAATDIVGGIASGSITPVEGTLLQSDLAVLARTLGVAGVGSTPTTSPGSVGGNGPGNGHGHGNGNGH